MPVLLSQCDHAIVVTSNYQAAETVPLSVCGVTGIPLDAENSWELDIDRLRSAIRPNTKVVSINFPNNPTDASSVAPNSMRSLTCAAALTYGYLVTKYIA